MLDHVIYISITSAADMDKLQSDLKDLELWQNTLQMEFNPEKYICLLQHNLNICLNAPLLGIHPGCKFEVESPSSWNIF